MRLVIVDDEPVICNGLSTLIEKSDWGWKIEGVFSDPEEALENCDWDQIQAVIVDINMPNIDGLSLVHVLRERGYETSVIFITAYARFDYAQKAIGERALDYLLKPVSRKNLEEALKKAKKIYLEKTQKEEDPQYIRANIDYLRKRYFSDLIFEEREIDEVEKQKKELLYYFKGKRYGLFEFVTSKSKAELKSQLQVKCAEHISWYLYGHEYFFIVLFLYDTDQKEEILRIIQKVESEKCSYCLDIQNVDRLPEVYQKLLVKIRKYYNGEGKAEERMERAGNEELPEELSVPVRQAISYINSNLNRPLSLQSIAMAVYLHPTYLSNIFKKQTGYTVVNYINQRRIQEAKHLLEDSQNKVCWVMEQVGFVNQRYFGKVFKEVVGMTPTQYKYEMFFKKNQSE